MPVKAGLKDRSLHMFNSEAWVGGMLSSDLVPHVNKAESGLVHTGCRTPLTVHQYHEAFDPLHVVRLDSKHVGV